MSEWIVWFLFRNFPRLLISCTEFLVSSCLKTNYREYDSCRHSHVWHNQTFVYKYKWQFISNKKILFNLSEPLEFVDASWDVSNSHWWFWLRFQRKMRFKIVFETLFGRYHIPQCMGHLRTCQTSFMWVLLHVWCLCSRLYRIPLSLFVLFLLACFDYHIYLEITDRIPATLRLVTSFKHRSPIDNDPRSQIGTIRGVHPLTPRTNPDQQERRWIKMINLLGPSVGDR